MWVPKASQNLAIQTPEVIDAMQQVKIFKAVESELETLEAEVNEWLAESKARVINMFGNIAPQSRSPSQSAGLTKGMFPPSDVLLVILFEAP